MKKDIGYGANGGEASDESFVKSSISGKEYVSKKKVVKKRHAQKHDSDSEVDVDWIAYKNYRGWI